MVVTMLLLLWLMVVVVPLPRRPSKLTAAEHVNVEVVHGLRAVLAVVHHEPAALPTTTTQKEYHGISTCIHCIG